MCDTPFKTPLSHTRNLITPNQVETSDSEESVASLDSEGSSAGSSNDLSLVAMFDDLMRLMRHQRGHKMEDALLSFLLDLQMLFKKYKEVINDCNRLQNVLDLKVQENSELEIRLKKSRQILDEQKKQTQRVIRQNQNLQEQLEQVREILFKDNKMNIIEEAKEKLLFLNQVPSIADPYGGSMLSDFSISRSEDDLDVSRHFGTGKEWKKHKPSEMGDPEPATKKRRSSNKVIEIGRNDIVRATTMVTVNNKGPISATSVIESIPKAKENIDPIMTPDEGIGSTAPSAPLSHLIFESWARQGSPRKPSGRCDLRAHCLQQKTIVMPDSCVCCEKRIKFGKSAFKCKECRWVCHTECKDNLPLPCVPVMNTPNLKNAMGIISDYTPTTPPMVPALILHCVNEIELRGFNELGLYRIPGSEKDVKMLKERFLKGRSAPCLNQVDIHVICGCVKDFLRSLTESIVTFSMRPDFVRAIRARDGQDVAPLLYQCISELPQPNRDTLAYMTLHLQKIAESPECKMTVENLAKIFGPTIVGYSSDNPNPNDLLTETREQIAVMEHLIRLPSEYWSTFINSGVSQPVSRLQQTPSTDSLFRPNSRFFTPYNKRVKKQRIFTMSPGDNF
ncbi:rac GTPase-activating protein 1 isoform X2 [Cylas formicarius]|uniref:rac GTPase-activating protein 1 isoform X2 n=1 Tax=Cylas formicarius TaxID=197179 RepID=UPI00295885B8|nr:rac GTPase-activating protein 1 isoform X2 [Cylas formicarius]